MSTPADNLAQAAEDAGETTMAANYDRFATADQAEAIDAEQQAHNARTIAAAFRAELRSRL